MRKLWALAMVAGLALSGNTRAEIRYSITDLGTLGGVNSYASAINEFGQVVGSSETGTFYGSNSPITHSFLFDGTLHDVSLVAQHRSDGNAINNLGHVAGMFEHTGFIYDGFYRYVPNSGSTVSAINDSDIVVGEATLPVPTGGGQQAFRFDGATVQFLGTLGGNTSYASGINNAGVIVGDSETAEVVSGGGHKWRAFIYDGSMHAIPGAEQGGSSASDINDSGQIVGNNNGHAFMYDGKMHDLSPGPELSLARAINNFGVVVGEYYPTGSSPYPRFFIYDGSYRILDDLIDKSLGYTLTSVSDINDAGQMAATAYINWPSYPTVSHAVVLTPIGPAVRHVFDIATPAESGAVNSIRIYGGDKAQFWYSIMNANRDGVPDPHNGIYDSGEIYHPGSGIGLGQFRDAAGDSYLLIRLTRMGDVNLDGQVSIADFLALASHFNSTGTWQEGDLNYDGLITIADFIALASNFGTSYSGEAVAIADGDAAMLWGFAAAHGVPEPSGVMVMLAGIALELRRRRGNRLRDGEEIAERVWE